jgi:hypothetical protein
MEIDLVRATTLLAEAKVAAASGDHVRAEELYQEAVMLFPGPSRQQVEALIGLADCIDALGRNSGLMRAVAKAVSKCCDKLEL